MGRKKKVRDQTTRDKRGNHRRQTDKDILAGVQGNRPKRKGATDQEEKVILLEGRTACMGEGKKREIL